MGDMEKFCRIVEDELKKIAEKGLNTANLETAYKLIDMYKDIKNTEYWEIKNEYYLSMMDGGYSHNSGDVRHEYSERGRKRDSMGRYSREDADHRNRYEDGNSYGRHGGYSRASYSATGYDFPDNYDRYIDSKHSYRANKSPECKQRLMDTLEEYMDDFSKQMEEMLKDSDCAEERNTIKRYLDKLKNIS